MKPIFILSIISIFVISCKTGNPIQPTDVNSGDELVFDKTILNVVDSFSLELEKYTHYNKKMKDTVRLVGYIRLKESIDDKIFVLHLEGIKSDSLLKSLKTNDFFKRNGHYFCIDYNFSSIIKTTRDISSMYEAIIDYSNIKNFSIPSRIEPSWLIKVQDGKVVRIKKNAFSIFDTAPRGTISIAKDGSIIKHRIDEWGDIYDEEGNKIDSLR